MKNDVYKKLKGILCVRIFSNIVKQDCAVCNFEKIQEQYANLKADLNMSKDIQRERLSLQAKWILRPPISEVIPIQVR